MSRESRKPAVLPCFTLSARIFYRLVSCCIYNPEIDILSRSIPGCPGETVGSAILFH